MNIFFDLDGTLIDSIYDIANSVNLALIANDLASITLEEARTYIGHGSKNLIIKASHNKFSSKLYADYKRIYHENLCNLSKPYQDVVETLKILKNNGHQLGVYSNKDEQDVVKIVGYYFPNIFDYVIGKRTGYNLKPDPTLMQDIIKQNNLNLCSTYYVGDMQTDYDLAKNLNIKFVFASYGYGKKYLDNYAEVKEFKDLIKLFD